MDLNVRVDVICEKVIDPMLLQIFFIFDTFEHQAPTNSLQNFSKIYPAILEKKMISLALLILALAAILDSRPD